MIARPRPSVAPPARGPGFASVRLDTPLQFLRGVGPKLAGVFAARGLATVEDLLYYLPFRYEDRTLVRAIGELRPGETATVAAQVRGARLLRTRGGRQILRLAVSDGTGRLDCIWFHAEYLRDRFHQGQRLALYGRVEGEPFAPEFRQPEFEVLADAAPAQANDEGPAPPPPVALSAADSLKLGRIVPIYPAIATLSSARIRWLVASAFAALPPRLPDAFPAELCEKWGLPGRREALEQVHFPAPGASLSELLAARSPGHRRLILEELFFLQFGLEVKRRKALRQPGPVMDASPAVRERLKRILPFHPTADQKRALKEIVEDLRAGHPMRRLLQGDVGSGKTIVALEAAVVAIENGFQVALMVPTQILAAQHYLSARRRLGPAEAAKEGGAADAAAVNAAGNAAGYRVHLLTAATRAPRRRAPTSGAPRAKSPGAAVPASQEPHLIIGTQALLEGGFQFRRLGLIIVDEQHRFGVMQRFELMQKSELAAHLLVMTATPIPRTLALALYGDLETSLLRESPPGRPPCLTRLAPAARREELYEFVRRELRRGRQAYFVCPAIEENDSGLELRAAVRLWEELRARYAEFQVALLHGRLSEDEKNSIMRQFESNQAQVLVATSVIEVGLDVPNASVMVIEDAQRFGIAQLHQLRGRVGRPRAERPGGRAYCFLVAGEDLTDTARQRLEAVAATQDGFALADLDLKLRGPGEVFGTRQSGLPELEVADPLRDEEFLAPARAAAREFLDQASPAALRSLAGHIQARWQRKYGLVEVG